jgi:hypothetical protein
VTSESDNRLDATRRRLARWRRQFGGPGRPIPEEFWRAAAEVARTEGVGATALALRLDRRRLAQRVVCGDDEPERGAGAERATDGFVEIEASGLSLTRTVLRFESADGERLQVEVSGRSSVDVIALAHAFWSRR